MSDVERALTLTDSSGDKLTLTTEDQGDDCVLIAQLTMHSKPDVDGLWVSLDDAQVAELIDFAAREGSRWQTTYRKEAPRPAF